MKPYECTKCEAKFAFPSHLSAHIRSAHESDRPYECEICNSKFKIQHVLNAHMKRVHKIENQQNRRKKQSNVCNETENLSIIEKEDSVEYQLPYGWKKVCHHRPRVHGRFMVLGNMYQKKYFQYLRTFFIPFSCKDFKSMPESEIP